MYSPNPLNLFNLFFKGVNEMARFSSRRFGRVFGRRGFRRLFNRTRRIRRVRIRRGGYSI